MKLGKCISVLLWFVWMTAILWIVCSAAATTPQLNVTQERGILLKSGSAHNCEAPVQRTYCEGDILCVKIEEIDYTCCAIEAPRVEIILREFPHLATPQNQTDMGSKHNRHAAKSAIDNCDAVAPARAECEGGLVCKLLGATILYKCCPGGGPAPA